MTLLTIRADVGNSFSQNQRFVGNTTDWGLHRATKRARLSLAARLLICRRNLFQAIHYDELERQLLPFEPESKPLYGCEYGTTCGFRRACGADCSDEHWSSDCRNVRDCRRDFFARVRSLSTRLVSIARGRQFKFRDRHSNCRKVSRCARSRSFPPELCAIPASNQVDPAGR